MNVKKSLENRVRGWLPKEPSTPKYQKMGIIKENFRAQPKPETKMLPEMRSQILNIGVVVGIGITLVVIGLAGWSMSTLEYNQWTFNLQNAHTFYPIRDLLLQISIFLTLAVVGAVGTFLGLCVTVTAG